MNSQLGARYDLKLCEAYEVRRYTHEDGYDGRNIIDYINEDEHGEPNSKTYTNNYNSSPKRFPLLFYIF